MILEDVEQRAEELGFSYYEKHGIIDLDKQGTILGGTFTGDTAEQDASEWLQMHSEYGNAEGAA